MGLRETSLTLRYADTDGAVRYADVRHNPSTALDAIPRAAASDQYKTAA